MEEHEAVKVRVVRVERVCIMHRVEVLDVSGDFELRAQSVLRDATKRVGRRARRQGKFVVAVGHALRADEDEVDGCAREDVRELQPDVPWQRGLCARAEDEDADRRRFQPQAVNVFTFTLFGRVQSIS